MTELFVLGLVLGFLSGSAVTFVGLSIVLNRTPSAVAVWLVRRDDWK